MFLNGGHYGGAKLLGPATVREMTRNQLPPVAMPVQMSGFKRQGLGFGLGFSVRVKTSGLESAALPNGKAHRGGQ